MTIRPPRRLIALGASNLTRILPRLCELAAAPVDGAVEVFAAAGFGRSFGKATRFLGRQLPGIADCGLWDALAGGTGATATGVVMDVGNDILYGVDAATIVSWVDRTLARLRPQVARLVLADLPGGLDRVGAARFALVRRVLVPGCPLDRDAALRCAAAVRAGLQQVAQRHGAELLPMPAVRYGLDPIHVRPRHWRPLCCELLGEATFARWPAGRLARLGLAWSVRRARAASLVRGGRERCTAQPSVRGDKGFALHLF